MKWVVFCLLLCFVPVASAVLTDAEVYWAFDEGSGTTAIDSSGNGNTGTVTGASYVTGLIGLYDLAYAGSGQYVSSSYQPTVNDFSIYTVINTSSYVQTGWMANSWATGAPSEWVGLGMVSSISSFRFTVDFGDSCYREASHPYGSYSVDEKLFLAGVLDSSNDVIKLYVNGVNVANTSTSGCTEAVSFGSALAVGQRADLGGSERFTGTIGDMGIYERVLSTAEILDIYNGGVGLNPYASPPVNATGNVTFSASEIISGLNITSFNVTIGAQTEDESYVWELAPANYTAVFSADGYFSKNLSVEVFENVTTQYNFTNVSNHQLVLTLSSAVGAGNEGLWEVNFSSDNHSYSIVDVVNVSEVITTVWQNTTTSFTTSSSFVTLINLSINDTPLLDGIIYMGCNVATCEFRRVYHHTDGSQSVSGVYEIITAGSATSGVSFTNLSLKPVSLIEFQARRTSGVGSGARYVSGTSIEELNAFIYFPELIHGNYTAVLSSVGDWVPNSYSVELVSSQNFTYFDIEGYIVGTIEFLFRNSETNALLSGVNVSASLVSNATSYDFFTTTGLFNLTNVTSGVYTLSAEATNYSEATVFVTVADDNQTVNVFLEPGAVQILFSVVDTLGNNVPDATLTFLRVINDTPTVVAQSVTDFSGFSFVNLVQAQNYLFTVAADGYITFSGDVTPFASLSPYTVRLRPDAPSVDNPSTAFVQTFIRPIQAVDDSWFYVEFETLSPTGVLSWFAIDSTYLSVTQSDNVSGVPGGGIVSVNFTNINISQASTVTVQFSFDAVGYNPVVWNKTFVLAEFVGGNFTIQNVFEDAAGELGFVGRHILGSLVVLLALAAGFFASSNASLAGFVGLGAIGLVTLGGLFSLNIAILAAVFISILILADNVLGGGA